MITNKYRQKIDISTYEGEDISISIRATVDGNPLDWNTVTPKATVRDFRDIEMIEMVIGDGLSINPDDNEQLIMNKPSTARNLIPGNFYDWDLLVVFSPTVARYPVGGRWIVNNSITHNE